VLLAITLIFLAIESVLEQTYQNFELIVVDDGSTDNSREVIEAYKDRLTAIFQEENAEALNAGIAQSKGEIICFWMLMTTFKDKLAKVVAGFLDHPEWVQTHCWISVNREGLPTNQRL